MGTETQTDGAGEDRWRGVNVNREVEQNCAIYQASTVFAHELTGNTPMDKKILKNTTNYLTTKKKKNDRKLTLISK